MSVKHKINIIFRVLIAYNVINDIVIRSNKVANERINMFQQHRRFQMAHIFGGYDFDPFSNLFSNLIP